MAKTGLQNEKLVKLIQEKGSTALKGRNSFGVNVFSGSVNDDGIISGQLTKTKYNNEELVKSVDTNIFELLPPEIPPVEDLVPRQWWNDALNRVSQLEIEIQNLNVTISDLRAIVNELRIVSQSLRIELDSKDLIVASVENQNQQSILQTQSTIIDLQNAIQKATSEAIERTSLEAINQSIISENESLNLENEDLQVRLDKALADYLLESQISAEQEQGAFSNGQITANPQISDDGQAPITWRGRPRKDFRDGKFINGGIISVFNPQESTVSVSVKVTGFSGKSVFSARNFNVPANGRYQLKLSPNIGAIDSLKSGKDSLHLGSVVFTTPDGVFEIPAELQIQRGKKYDRPS